MAARKKKTQSAELSGQPDPRAPLDSAAFLAQARPVLGTLTSDLLERADASPAVTRALEARHAAEHAAQRTAEGFVTWRRSFVDQVAAAWLLSCVFVRTLEDRGLVGQARLAGPGAADSQRLFLELAPSLTERDYLLTVFRELVHVPAARELFDAKHNPVWLLAPSAQAAKALLQLFHSPHADAPAFRFGQADTRFLGDLYQDLNDDVKKRFALLQTPRFVESFILDRTLERAIERFGLNDTQLIDPTCGSGHFLLGAFERLVDHRLRAEPGLDVREAARRALDQVFGADINPYAVAIARFRLTLAFLEKAGYATLAEAPAVPLHLVVADSLLHNPHLAQLELGDQPRATVAAWKGEEFALEDEAAARAVLHERYAAVVGNPPYITVKDAVLRERYRGMYKRSAAGKYSVAAPFTERFFQLGREGAAVGMITANSFMKREFGKKLIEEYLPSVNLDLVINTSGAYIPGHGTPTVLLFGTSEGAKGSEVHVVLASRGEPSTPEDPEQGLVWRSIADHWSEIGFENDYVTVMRFERATLSKHPWSLGGGGASELKELLEDRATRRLGDLVASIGRSTHTGEDSFFFMPVSAADRLGIPRGRVVPLVKGEQVRDWSISEDESCLFPYDLTNAQPRAPEKGREAELYWQYRALLRNRQDYGEKIEARGLAWYEHSMFFPERFLTPLSIAFAEVATHNHFVLDRGGKVFKQTAPIIKLPEPTAEDDHYALLAYLNSSTACFWMKQVSHKKSSASQKHHADPARAAYAFTASALCDLPLPNLSDLRDAAQLCAALEGHALARTLWMSGARLRASAVGLEWSKAGIARFIEAGWREYEAATGHAVYLQEELDWLVYAAFGLAPRGEVQLAGAAALGARPFEHSTGYADGVSERARTTGTQERSAGRPGHWTTRIQLLESDSLAVIETSEFKRMWRDSERNVDQREYRARLPREWLEGYALDLLESAARSAPTVRRAADLLTEVAAESHLRGAAEFLDEEAIAFVRRVLAAESLPYVAAQRLTEAGLEKLLDWQQTWSLQRREDAGENVGEIPIPPKYDQKDYRDANYWRLRGKLDVPKERFISYLGCESDEDGEPVYGWAGWDHAQRARALGTLYYKRKTDEGWKKERLTPMLAGLLELLPWLHQWHAEPDDEYGGQSPAKYFQDFLDGQCAELGLTHEDLREWRPAEKRSGRGRKRSVRHEDAEDPG